MPMCSALYCNNRPHKDSGKSFHRFPHKNPDLMGQWLMNVHRDNFSPSQAAVVCSDHFEESCFDRTQQKVSLRENSIPTIFQTSKHPSKSHDHSAYDPEKTSSKIPKTCAVSGCKQRSRKNGISLHKFPLDSELCRKWIDALKIENFTPSELAVVCSKHFRDEDLYRSGFRVYLRKGVVPSIFPQLTADLERESESTESPQARRSPRKYGLHRKQSVAVRGRKYPATDQALTSIPPPIRCPQPAELEEARTGKRKAEAAICTDATKKTTPYRELRPKTTYTASESLRPEVMAVETKVESGGSHVTEPYESLTQNTAAELPCKAESEALPCLTGRYVSGCNTQPLLVFGNVVYQPQPPVVGTLSDQQPQLQPESSSCMYAALRRIVQHDHSYVCTDSPESLKRQLLTATDKIKKLKQELINANRRNKRCYRLLRLLIKSTRKS